ncbi:hypothetical protein [Streptomyces sp. RerS4]|uniref:hypothetical protein n=1 Tax=Streptomyces sp. RerS4 TaxID=2942449 RepID=UPI00201BECE6|nr:hypothetical protein [Streptomyces sp. RerS4]UQW99114.1 hypothetical protein M4D82_00085 [Streptomyces sp. RerS4]
MPAVARRRDRFPQHPMVLMERSGLRYAGGSRQDQVDPVFEVLWERWGGAGIGAPEYAVFDPEVQRRATDRLLCVHCLGWPDRDPRTGMLWLLHAQDDADVWPADILTITPPICRLHARHAVERCAGLRLGYVAVRVREAEPVGVIGTLYDRHGAVVSSDELVLFTDTHRIRHVLARYLVLELRGAVPDPTVLPTPAADRNGAPERRLA